LQVVKEPPKMVLRRIIGPSLKTGVVLDAALSGKSWHWFWWMSVMAVQEKC